MDSEAPARPTLGVSSHPVSRLLVPAAALVAAVAVAHGLWVLAQVASPMPYQDHWEFLTQLVEGQGGLAWSALWTPHNEHRLVLVRLLLLADVWLAAARGTSLIALHVLLLAGFALALAGWAGLAGRARFLFTALCLGVLLSAADTIPVTEPFSISFTLALICLGGAVWALASGQLLAALLGAALATLSCANGLLVWPLLLALAWLRGCSRAWFAALALVGSAVIAAYLWQHPLWTRESGQVLAALGAPFAVLRFVALLLAGPVGQVHAELGRVWGVLLIFATAVAALRFWQAARRGKAWPRGRTVLLALALFLVACAATAALMRLDTTPRPPRYSVMALTFSLCLAGLWAGEMRPVFARLSPHKLALVLALVTVGATALYAPRQAREAAARHAQLVAASAVLRADRHREADLQTLAAIAPDPLRPLQLRPFLVAHRLSIFADAP